MYTHIHIPGAWYMDTTAQEKYVIPAVLRKAQEGSSFAELAAGFGLTAAPPAAAEGMRGDCIQLPQPSPLPYKRGQLQTSGKLSSKAMGAPWSLQIPSHPG